ncbi:sirohydrochlorin chelatase [Microbacterium halophytorum]|uniref:sirohydrochlorin chelatase n=1 Tax=Microbacterium halophytorum TaxID=2067568 RepID=UPI000CFC4C46|nr:CbiX/SirB N-terminal domain-containing protein [Microbacterium halophytorum]
MTAPALVCCSHGTDSTQGRRVIRTIARRTATALDVKLHEAFVDVQEPKIDDVIRGFDGPAVIVPLLLSPGFHTSVDIGRAAGLRDDVDVAGTLGPHPFLADILSQRVRRCGPTDAVVLAAAGSSRPEAAERVRAVQAALAERLPLPVTVGYAYGATPRVAEAVAEARAAGAERVTIASYVLAPGHFANLIADSGADAVTDPVGTDPRVVDIAVQRYREALLVRG